MKCEYLGGNLKYKSETKMMCHSGNNQYINFILMDSIISNKETVDLKSLLKYKKKEKGVYASYIPENEYYPVIQTIPENCSFILESATQICKLGLAILALISLLF